MPYRFRMDAFTKLILGNRRIVLSVVTLITLIFAITLLNLRVNSSPYFLSEDHPSRVHEKDIRTLFSNTGEQVLVVLAPDNKDALSPATVLLAKNLGEQFSQMNLIEENDADFERQYKGKENYLRHPVKHVRSIATIENMTSSEDELDLHPLLPDSLSLLNGESPEYLSFKREALDNPLFKGLLLSNDGHATSVQIELNIPKDNNRMIGKLYNKILQIIEDLKSSSDYSGQVYLAGSPVIDAEMARSMERDNLIFFPFVMLVISSILFFGFRTSPGVIIPLTVAGLTTIWTLGVMVALGIEQNIVTTILPVFLLTIAVADTIHFYGFYLNNTESHLATQTRVEQTLSHLLRPLVLTSITTTIGFLALAYTDLIFVRQFGLLMALGVMFALVITLVLAPIMLVSQSQHNNKVSDRKGVPKPERLLRKLVISVMSHPIKTSLLTLLIFCSGLISLQSLQFDQENINAFGQETTLRSHNEAILQHYDGTIPIDIWIATSEKDGLHDPDVILGIKKIVDYLKQRDDIGFVLSPVGFLERMYDLLTQEGHKLPSDLSGALIAQEFLVYENEESQDIKHVIDDMHQHARIIVLGKSDAASFWEPILKDIQALTPTGTHVEINGYGKVMFTNIQAVIKSHLSSTVLAVIFIGLVMIVLFRSLAFGLIGVAPLILTVVVNFALMSVLGVAVDVGTTIIASIAFGIGIDYSIHILSTLKRLETGDENKGEISANVLEALRINGTPILINSITLAAGFLVLVVSSFKVLQVLGVFIAFTMLISAFNAIVLIPLLYSWRYRRSSVSQALNES